MMSPAPLREIANLLVFATSAHAQLTGDPFGRTQRPAISAGALHPIHLCIVPMAGTPRAFHYDAHQQALEILSVARRSNLILLVERAKSMLPDAHGSLLVLLAEPEKTRSVYRNSSSLVWRDAGAVLQLLHLCATAYRLAFCPLGMLGSELTRAVFPRGRTIEATGTAVLGRASVPDASAAS